LAYLKIKAKEYFLDPRNRERLDQVGREGEKRERGGRRDV